MIAILSLFACVESEIVSDQVEVGTDVEIENGVVEEVETVPGTGSDDENDDVVIEEVEPACEFVVETWDGEVVMGNTLSVSLNASSPSGASVPGHLDVLTVDFTADDPKCADLLVTSYGVKGVWTDGAAYVDEDGIPQYGWMPTWIGGSIDGELVSGVAPTIPAGHAAYATMAYPFVVHAGETVTVTVSANLDGASAELDDSVLFNIIGTAIGVYDSQSEPRMLMGDDVIGNTIMF